MKILVAFLAGLALFAQPDQPADPPHAGSWRLNLSKSDFGETTVTYAQQAASGETRFTAMGQSYTFRIDDGQDHPSLFGSTSAWKTLEAGVRWEVAIKQNGKLINTSTITLSPDGQSLTTLETGPKPTGGTFERTTIYRRASGDKGLEGAWKTRNPPRMPRHVELVASGVDGLTIRFPDDQEICVAKFDGQDYPVTGPIAQPSMTLGLRKTSPRSFDVTGKQYGKPIFTIAFTVSADGQALTQTGRMTGANEPFAAVYDRQ